MGIKDLTIREFEEIKVLLSNQQEPKTMFEVGKKYLVRTVTHIDVGEVIEIKGDYVKLKSAAWIADTGRYHDCLQKGVFDEVEPYPDGMEPFFNQTCMIDACEWPHDLPRAQK